MRLPGHLSIVNGELRVNGVSLTRLADEYGTPLYILSIDRVREKFRSLMSRVREYWEEVLICYAYKANTTLALLKALKNEGAGAEVVSRGELYAAKLVGVAPHKVVFNGVCKLEEEIADAIEYGVGLLNIENLGEMDVIKRVIERFGLSSTVFGVRVNLDVPAETHEYISTGMRIHKFGLDPENALKAYVALIKLVGANRCMGVHIHIGSQILSVEPFESAVKKLISFCRILKNKLGVKIGIVDLGGGLGIPYEADQREFPLEIYCEAVLKPIVDSIGDVFLADSLIILEPGRYLVGDAGVLLARVRYVKETAGIKWILIDAGMNDLIRPALYGAKHRVVVVGKADLEPRERYWIGGPICESSDVFARDCLLPKVEPGDLIALLDTGAYGISMASQYNCRPRPPVVVVDDGEVRLARRRESIGDLFSCEIF